MSRQQKRLPYQIDPFRLAESGAELAGPIPLTQLQRLSPLLADDSGEVNVVLNFDIDELGVPFVKGHVTAVLKIACQRCLEPMDYPVEQDIILAWVRNDVEAERLPLRYEPYLVEESPLLLRDVVEDELLLALPNVPMHDEKDCPASEWLEAQQQDTHSQQEEDENPFSILNKLKDK